MTMRSLPNSRSPLKGLACGRAARSPNWLPEWAPASLSSRDLKAAKRYRARRRSRADRKLCRTKSQIGAPRPMKMGNIGSPWRYDRLAEARPYILIFAAFSGAVSLIRLRHTGREANLPP